jgi:quercetin dioxygenase-like cupin family protein
MTDPTAVVIDSEQIPEETFEWGTLKWLCNAKLSPGSEQTVGLCHIWPGKRNPRHFHPNCEEVLVMLAGTGQHSFDDEMFELHRGSVIRIPAGVHHNMANAGTETIVCLISFSSGHRETVFLEPA